jgi:hypothetical protein
VVFLPESCLVADDIIFWLKLAFALPFADLPATMQRILQFKNTEDFVEFTRCCREDIYFLVDGFDLLQPDLKMVISALTSSHFHIYTTYALDTWTPTLRRVSSIRIPSGMTSDELAKWLHHFESQLPTRLNKGFLEYFCGAAPALLQPLFKYRGEDFADVCLKFRMESVIQTPADHVIEFHAAIEKLSKGQNDLWVLFFVCSISHSTCLDIAN